MLKTLTLVAVAAMAFTTPLNAFAAPLTGFAATPNGLAATPNGSAAEPARAAGQEEALALRDGCAAEALLDLRRQSPRVTTASVISPLGGCGWPEHLECLDLCGQAADTCYNSCTTPLCRFQCIQQARDCEFACDSFYCGF